MRFHASARRDERRREPGRAAAGRAWSRRGRRSCATRAASSRRYHDAGALRDAAHRGRALLALLGEPGPDARAAALAREPRRRGCTPTSPRTSTTSPTAASASAARRPSTPRTWAGSGRDVWHAHCVKLDAPGIALFARTGTGVAHCPCSNMRLGSGIAPVRAMRDAGVEVGLGVDGRASQRRRRTCSPRRARRCCCSASASGRRRSRRARRWRSRRCGGARGARARRRRRARARHGGRFRRVRPEPATASPARCTIRSRRSCSARRARASLSVIDGRVVVREGRLATLELEPLIERHNRLARALVDAN